MNIDTAKSWYLRRARHPFKAKIVGHYWGWFSRQPLWVQYDHTLRFKADLRDYVQQTIFFEGYYEPRLVSWLKANLRPSDIFWDVGANVGAFTLIAAKLCRHVVAFEPEPRTRERLQQHVAANRLENTSILPFALSASDGEERLFLGPKANSGMHSIVRNAEGAQSVQITALKADTVLKQAVAVAPTVMKVDVEGAELLVFEGASELLRAPELRAIVFEAAEAAPGILSSEEIHRLLRDSGFEVSVLGYSDDEVDSDLNNFIATRIAS